MPCPNCTRWPGTDRAAATTGARVIEGNRFGGLEDIADMTQRLEKTDPPHVVAAFEAREGVFDLRAKLDEIAHKHPGLREEIDPVLGSLTCCMTALYDTIERLRRNVR